MLYRGTKPAALYRGAYKPGKLYKGAQLVAGYEDVSKAAPASWDGTYDDVIGVAAQGRGRQQTYSGTQLLDISTCTANSAQPFGLHVSIDGDVIKIQGISTTTSTAASNWRSFLKIIDLPDTSLSGQGYVFTPFVLQGTIATVYGLRTTTEKSIYLGMTLTEGEAVDVALRLMVSVSAPTAYEPYVGGKPSPSPDYPQPLVAAEGSLTASGRTGTTSTTVTLPTLRAIPGTDIHDTLEFIGGGQWKVTRRVGVIHLTGAENWYIGGGSYQCSQNIAATGTVGRCDTYAWVFDRSGAGMYVTGKVVALGAAAATVYGSLDEWKTYLAERYDKEDPLTLWVQLAAPTTETVTLGELHSYPVQTALAVNGDYPPDVTGTVKVGI